MTVLSVDATKMAGNVRRQWRTRNVQVVLDHIFADDDSHDEDLHLGETSDDSECSDGDVTLLSNQSELQPEEHDHGEDSAGDNGSDNVETLPYSDGGDDDQTLPYSDNGGDDEQTLPYSDHGGDDDQTFPGDNDGADAMLVESGDLHDEDPYLGDTEMHFTDDDNVDEYDGDTDIYWSDDGATERPFQPAQRPAQPVGVAQMPAQPVGVAQRPAQRPAQPVGVAQRPAQRPAQPVGVAQRPARRPGQPVGLAQRPARRPGPQPEWVWQRCQRFIPNHIPCTARTKRNVDLPENPREFDYFGLYFTDDIINLIVRETNRYATQYIEENADTIRPHSNVRAWKRTNSNEIITFTGLLLLMGIVYKPRLPLYWSTDDLYNTPIFSQVMNRDRFLLLLKFLHFANNDGYDPQDPERDRLHKIREFSNMIKNRCKTVVTPGKHICVDESLVLYKGRLAFKQYIRTKRARFGIKFYSCCTSDGVTLDYMIYHGGLNAHLGDFAGFGTTEKIALTLVADYMQQGRCLYLDNFYTTPKLAAYLLDHNTTMVGTVRNNRRNFPRELARQNIQRGESIFYKCDEKKVLAVKYRAPQDKSGNKPKIVHVLSTCHNAEVRETMRQARDGTRVRKPACIISYNNNMGGVDVVDQVLEPLHVLRKTYKWYKKIFLRLIMVSLLNSHKLYHIDGGKLDFLNFLHNVIADMLTYSPRLNRACIRENFVARLTGRNHFPTKRLLPPGSKRGKSKYMSKICRVCSARGIKQPSGKPVYTNWICEACPGQPGLHCDMPEHECFKLYHTVLDFSVP
jgi:hypothetical protein